MARGGEQRAERLEAGLSGGQRRYHLSTVAKTARRQQERYERIDETGSSGGTKKQEIVAAEAIGREEGRPCAGSYRTLKWAGKYQLAAI